jgi:hypothetical protein
MTDFDYKKYSLENLSKWAEDSLTAAEATPQEIYNTIHKVVEENYYYHKHHASRAYELMEKLNGSDNLFPRDNKVTKWIIPVELDGLTGECYIQLPDDLLAAADLKEGDQVEWIDRGDGSFEMRKVNGTI